MVSKLVGEKQSNIPCVHLAQPLSELVLCRKQPKLVSVLAAPVVVEPTRIVIETTTCVVIVGIASRLMVEHMKCHGLYSAYRP